MKGGDCVVCGVGYVKEIRITKEIRYYYKRWKNMIERCYYRKNTSYKRYGGNGVVVSEEWKCFDNWYNDIKTLDGWDERLFLCGEIQLDKDSVDPNNKTYCKEKCVWLTAEENARIGYEKQEKPIVAMNEELGIVELTTQRKVARKYNLTLTNINRCLKGRQSQHKGWKFRCL